MGASAGLSRERMILQRPDSMNEHAGSAGVQSVGDDVGEEVLRFELADAGGQQESVEICMGRSRRNVERQTVQT